MLDDKNSKLTVIAGIVALILMLFLIYHQVDKLQAAQEELAQNEFAVANAQAYFNQLAQMKQQMKGYQEKLAVYELLLPTRPGEELLINDLKSYIDKTTTKFMEIRFDSYVDKKEAGYVEMPFSVSFSGQYYGLLDLLLKMQDGSRLIRIDTIKVGKDQQSTDDIRVDITASAFYANRE